MDILNQKANRECSIFKTGLNLNGKSSTFPSSELISQKGAYSMSADLLLKINKSRGSDSGNDLPAGGKKNEDISGLTKSRVRPSAAPGLQGPVREDSLPPHRADTQTQEASTYF